MGKKKESTQSYPKKRPRGHQFDWKDWKERHKTSKENVERKGKEQMEEAKQAMIQKRFGGEFVL